MLSEEQRACDKARKYVVMPEDVLALWRALVRDNEPTKWWEQELGYKDRNGRDMSEWPVWAQRREWER